LSIADLGQVFDSVPTLSRLYEVHTLRRNTSVLLDTYLGLRGVGGDREIFTLPAER
jgi:hypothetical protein